MKQILVNSIIVLCILITCTIIFGTMIIYKNQEIISLKSELEKARGGNTYERHNPTFLEVSEFIAQDKTDELNYENEKFTCKDFAQVVNNNAEKKGIRCAYVLLGFVGNVSHGIIGFNTTDKGMVYIEPQTDEWIQNLEIGKDYWTDCVITKEDSYFYGDKTDDTIEGILLYCSS